MDLNISWPMCSTDLKQNSACLEDALPDKRPIRSHAAEYGTFQTGKACILACRTLQSAFKFSGGLLVKGV